MTANWLSVILVFMKKSRDLLFQTEAPLGVAHGCRVREEVPLYFRGEIVPLKDNRSAQTPQNTLLSCQKRVVLPGFRSSRQFRGPALALPTPQNPGEIIKIFRNLSCFGHGRSVTRTKSFANRQLRLPQPICPLERNEFGLPRAIFPAHKGQGKCSV
jgi:hypothetical protein